MRLVSGLHPDPPGKLTEFPKTPSWIKGAGRERGRERKMGKEEMGKDKDPSISVAPGVRDLYLFCRSQLSAVFFYFYAALL